ncbi:CynX/NimT family MFS transporter [Streptomyces sp. NPDC101150]|uniref:CynX/NimT family MFS transporter n=1 Tax=Streptomyces sp. NPDC101150 TaxID=3366114 RepID=UPI0037F7EE64
MSAHARKYGAVRIWILAGVVLLAVNLRPAITCVTPVLAEVKTRYRLGAAGVSILTTLPVLCLGVFALAAAPLARRIGAEAAIALALSLICAGVLLRGVPSPIALYAGTALAGTGTAVGNVLMPAVIKRRFPVRTGVLTGIAMTLMAGSGALAAGLAVPLQHVVGWHIAFAAWAAPSLIAALVWLSRAARTPHARTGGRRPSGRRTGSGPAPVQAAPQPSSRFLLRSGLAWAVAGYLGLVSLTFYVLVSWLPTIMRFQGHDWPEAATMLSTMMCVGIPCGFVVPALAARLRDQRCLVLAVTGAVAAGLGGLTFIPGQAWVWVCVLGIGTGSAFPLAMILLALRSATPHITTRLSGMAQTVGYLLAAVGPLTMGLLRSATGGWQIPLWILSGLLVPQMLLGWRAARPGAVQPPPLAVPDPVPDPARTMLPLHR